MWRILSSATFGLCVLTWAMPAQADDQADPRAIIERAIKASGGEDLLAKNQAQTWNETGTFYGMGEGLPFKGVYASQLPNQFKMAIENVFTIVINGDKGWMNDTEMNAEQLTEFKENNYAGWVSSLLPLKDKEFTLAAVEGTKVGNEPAVGVKVSHAGHRDLKLYFDKKTGLLVKVVMRAKAEDLGGKEVDQESELREYKDMNGIKVPMKVVITRDGKRYVEAEISDWKGSEKLPDSVFAKP